MKKAEAEVSFAVIINWAVTARDKAPRVVRLVPWMRSFPVSVVVLSRCFNSVGVVLLSHIFGSSRFWGYEVTKKAPQPIRAEAIASCGG